jgi:hypothetical protein
MPVRTWISIGNALESLHVIPQVVLLDARQKLARRIVDLLGALSRADRAGGTRREQARSDAQRREP